MKRIIPVIFILVATVAARAQLLESKEYSGIGATGVAVHGCVEFWKNTATTGTVVVDVSLPTTDSSAPGADESSLP